MCVKLTHLQDEVKHAVHLARLQRGFHVAAHALVVGAATTNNSLNVNAGTAEGSPVEASVPATVTEADEGSNSAGTASAQGRDEGEVRITCISFPNLLNIMLIQFF